MIRLLLKIFLAYWVAAGIVIAISDYEPHRHIHNPELTDALDSALCDERTKHFPVHTRAATARFSKNSYELA